MASRIAYVDGRRFRYAVLAGARHLIARKDHLDRINVFPVPDADTGTNMAASAKYIVETLRRTENGTLPETAVVLAEAALMGGCGNSGAILAQFFQGVSEGLARAGERTPSHTFAEALVRGAGAARQAVSVPREGTMLTVMRDWAESLQRNAASGPDIASALDAALDAAEKSLAQTTAQLTALREANVVDAGAQGFLYLLEGVRDLIANGWMVPDDPVEETEEQEVHVFAPGTEPNVRWCTECLIEGEDLDREAIRRTAEEAGDSVVVAGSGTRLRLHVHTDSPGDLFARLSPLGSLSREKADDMLEQFRHARKPSQQRVGIVTDSGCDLPDEILSALNIHQIPFRVAFGSDQYLDKVTLTSSRFYDLLQTSGVHPKTAQPSPADFQRAYNLVAKHYESVLSFHVPGALSGTLQAAQTAADQTGGGIRVIDSNSGSAGMGLIVMTAAEAARSGADEAEILRQVEEAIGRLVAYFCIETTEYLVKGGRVSKAKGLVGRLFSVRIIFKATPAGEIEVVESFLGRGNPRAAMLDLIEKGARGQRDVTVAIAHAAAPEKAAWYACELQARIQPRQILVAEFSPALGVHAGPGAVCIAALGQANEGQ